MTTEGVLVYSLDSDMTFDPYHLEIDITPETIQKTMLEKNYVRGEKRFDGEGR